MKQWGMFWLLGTIWGSSFLLIKVAVDDLDPLPLVAIRISLAALVMAVFLWATRRHFPKQRHERLALLFVGVVNTAIPFMLITWGEKDIDSGLATVLNATVPLFTLVFAHFGLPDERITPQKTLGLILGFVGVVLLASRSTESSSPNPVSGQLAVLAAAGCYGISAIVLRRYLRQVEPIATAGYALIIAAIVVVTIALVAAPKPDMNNVSTHTILAIVTLSLVNTVIAYFLFYNLMSLWGATRTTLVTYAMPPIGVTLGAVFLNETVDWRIVVGATLILGGIVVVNWRKRAMTLRPAPKSSAL